MIDILDIGTKEQKEEFIIREVAFCRSNFFYFLYNYIRIPYGGGGKEMTPEMMNYNMVRLIKCIFEYKDIVLDASRQKGKTTIAAVLILWYINFHSNVKVSIISYDQSKTKDILSRMRFMYEALPHWIKYKRKSLSERVLSFELKNGSSATIMSPSPQKPADTIGRGLTVGVIYVDEPSFIKDFDKMYNSARPGLETARKESEEMGIPSFLLMTATPNGVFGIGAPWYRLTHDSVNADSLFVKREEDTIIDKSVTFRDDHKKIFNIESKNYFVYVRYHWAEDRFINPNAITDENEIKQIEWYKKATSSMSERIVSQDYDLEYLGSSTAIFPDRIIKQFKQKDILETILLDFESRVDTRKLGEKDYLNIYDKNESVKNDYYIIGVDPAKSDTGDFAAIEVYSYLNFNQVAEYYLKPGSITRVSELTKEVIKYYYDLYDGRVIAIIENNFGNVVENLLNDKDFDKYIDCLYKDETKREHGIFTSRSNRKDMISYLYEQIKENPSRLRSKELINQVSTLVEKTGGRIEAGSGRKDDCVLASAFCAYIRYKTSFYYLPLITIPEKTRQDNDKFIDDYFSIMSPRQQDIYSNSNDDDNLPHKKNDGGFSIDDVFSLYEL